MTEQERSIIMRAQQVMAARRAKGMVVPLKAAKVPRRKSEVPFGGGIGRREWLEDEGAFLGDFYSFMRRRVPLIGNGLSAWVDLSSNCPVLEMEGGSDLAQGRAAESLKNLDNRVYEFDFEQAGFERLIELFFLGYYTNGRFAAEIVPFPSLNGVSHVVLIDPFSIKMRREGGKVRLYQKLSNNQPDRLLPEGRIFYSAFDPDLKHPYGYSLLDGIVWVVEIKEKMMSDMANASHNAGYPRLHVGIAPPEIIPGEAAIGFVGRADTEFTETVDAFRDLDVDDNIFTWSNVEVKVVGGGQSMDFNWSINFDRVNDEVVSGLRLYPWVLGLSASTTKNWVQSQHDLLMQRVSRGALSGARFLDWIRNTHLRLEGSPVRTKQLFEPIRDPGKLIQERAEKFEFDRVDLMVTRGYISKDEGARRMGLRGAFNQD